MLFVIIGTDSPRAQELRPLHREAHLAGLRKLEEKGRIVLAGPFLDKTGSLIVVDAASQEEAEKIANADPYVLNGIFEKVDVRPFKQVFPSDGTM